MVYIESSGLLQRSIPRLAIQADETTAIGSLQNAAARLITGAPRRDHITPILAASIWRWRVDFKIAVLRHSDICHAPDVQHLRIGDRSTAMEHATIWDTSL